MKKFATLAMAVSLALSPVLLQAQEGVEVQEVTQEIDASPARVATGPSGYGASEEEMSTDEFVIPNSPLLRPSNIITIRAIGMGVAPEATISPAQALVLAKRAAIADAYRQLGEKMYGIKLNAKDTIKDAVVKNTTVRTQVNAIIRNAEIQETVYKDGLCQVEMEVKLDGRRWYRVLSGY